MRNKRLAGTLFIRNGIQFDYCYIQAIACLLEFCDHVYVCDAGSDDGTLDTLRELKHEHLTLIERDKSEWECQRGREKLNYFTNICIERAEQDGYEYQFNLQADEIVTERSYGAILEALAKKEEGYMSTRINLWQSPYKMLDVPQNRKPCSTEIIRLTKTCYRSVGDAENIAAPNIDLQFLPDIRIYHMGFVRKREVMKAKIINMQEGVFEMAGHDQKLDGSEIFDPTLWFSEADLKFINEPLPLLIQSWAKERVYNDLKKV